MFGSTHPWYECLLLALGASHVTTVEYNKLTYSHPLLSTTTPSFLDTHPHFHTALSISRSVALCPPLPFLPSPSAASTMTGLVAMETLSIQMVIWLPWILSGM